MSGNPDKIVEFYDSIPYGKRIDSTWRVLTAAGDEVDIMEYLQEHVR